MIATVAGNGIARYSGDGGPATAAGFLGLGAVAVDGNGSLYIAETPGTYALPPADYVFFGWPTRIRRVSADGIITTLAGSGVDGYSGDGGPAANAQIAGVSGLAVDASGNLYLASFTSGCPTCSIQVDASGNYYIPNSGGRIRKVSAAGTISTVAGNGFLYVIGVVPPGSSGPATQTTLYAPAGVAVDSAGALYITDYYLRRVSTDGILTTIESGVKIYFNGDGGPLSDASIFGPAGMATDSAGNLYIAEYQGGRIRVITPAGIINTLAGSGPPARPGFSGDGGPATSAQLSWPKDVALDGSGNVYIADTGNSRIRMVSPGGIITTVAGTGDFGYGGDGGTATNAKLAYPSGLAVDGTGNLYVADTNNFRVRKISTNGIITTIAGTGVQGYSGDGGPATNAQLSVPSDVKIDGAGNLLIADGAAVRMVSPAGIIMTIAGTGVPGYSGDGGPATNAQLSTWGLALDRGGKVYVTDPLYNTVRVLTPIQ
jgi:sugar lactone lactonase YvrE